MSDYPEDQFLAEMAEREAVPVKTNSGYEGMVVLAAKERDRLVQIALRSVAGDGGGL